MMENVMVLGAGFMGRSIAQVCANGGYNVYLWDLTDELARAGYDSVAAGLEKQVARGKDTREHVDALMSRLRYGSDMSRAAGAGLVLEVVVEDIRVKHSMLRKVEDYCADSAIMGTNTSFIPITKLGECLRKPERFIGLHFFAPVYAMKLLEIIRGEKTSDETVAAASRFGEQIGKISVLVEKDAPGFIVNRINFATYLEAYKVMQEGVASIEDIDKAMRYGLNVPMGPFELNDFGGLDTVAKCLATLYELTGEERYLPVPELDAHVAKGELGRKSGKGWYDYSK